MKPRNKVPVDRRLLVADHHQYTQRITKAVILKALEKMRDDEETFDLITESGFEESHGWGMGMEDDNKVWFKRTTLTVRSYREETDEEYLKRMKDDERREGEMKERERLEYLRLKAKFES
jgi:hypothetical protein